MGSLVQIGVDTGRGVGHPGGVRSVRSPSPNFSHVLPDGHGEVLLTRSCHLFPSTLARPLSRLPPLEVELSLVVEHKGA